MYRQGGSGIEGWMNDPVETANSRNDEPITRMNRTLPSERRPSSALRNSIASERHLSSTSSSSSGMPLSTRIPRGDRFDRGASHSQSLSRHFDSGTVGHSNDRTLNQGRRRPLDTQSLVDLSRTRATSTERLQRSPEANERSSRQRSDQSLGEAAPSLGDFLSQNRADDSDVPTGSGEDTDDDDATFFSMFQWSKTEDASASAGAAAKQKAYSSSRSVGGRSMGGLPSRAVSQPRQRLARGSASVADFPSVHASPFQTSSLTRNGMSGLYSKSSPDGDDDDDDDDNRVRLMGTSKPVLRRSATSSGVGTTRGWQSSPEDDDDQPDALLKQRPSFRTSQRQLQKNDYLEKEASEKFDRFLREREEKIAAERLRSLQQLEQLLPRRHRSRSSSRNHHHHHHHHRSSADKPRSDDRDRERRHRDRNIDHDGEGNDDRERDRDHKKKKKKKERSSRKDSDGLERRERKHRDDGGERKERRHRGEGVERSERRDRGDDGDRERRRSSRRTSDTDGVEKLRSSSLRRSSHSGPLKEDSEEIGERHSSGTGCEEKRRSQSRRRGSRSRRSKVTSSDADGEEKLHRSSSRRRSSYSTGSKDALSDADFEDKQPSSSRRRKEDSGEPRRRRKSSSRKDSSRRRSKTDEIGDEAPRRIAEEGRAMDARLSSKSDCDSQFDSTYGTPSEDEEMSKLQSSQDDDITLLQFDPTKAGNIDQVVISQNSRVDIDHADGTRSVGHIREMPVTPESRCHHFSDSITASLTTSLESSAPSSTDRRVRRLLSTGGNMFRRKSKTAASDVVQDQAQSGRRGRSYSDDDDYFGVPHLTDSARSERPTLREATRHRDKDVGGLVRAKSTGRAESAMRTYRKRDSSRGRGCVRS